MKFKEALTFGDVLLRPKYSEITSRSEVDLSVEVCKGFKFNIPFMPANMASVVGKEMLRQMYKLGALGLMHRFCSVDEQINLFMELKEEFGENVFNFIGVSVGIKGCDYENISRFVNLGVKIVVVDIAHLDSLSGLNMVKFISTNYPEVLLIAGNVATEEAAERAWLAGADIVKCGIGSSGICSTRLEAAAGVPQLSALMEVQEKRITLEKQLNKKLFFISDGGHSITADCVKALCFADFVMLGGMFSGTTETPSREIEIDGKVYKEYSGSSTHKTDRVEGVKALVNPKGSVLSVIKKLSEGLQSGCSYQNCRNLKELKEDPTFVRITNSGLKETNIHDVVGLIE